MLKRLLDIIFSMFGILLLSPLFVVFGLLVKLTSKGPILYSQKRIGLHGKEFSLFKFRTMLIGADKKGLLTIGEKDARITNLGLFLRKYKLDELPQLINVFNGTMSFVGPRPEVKKYVDLYSEEQRKVLNIRPGITDWASIFYRHENITLGQSSDPEKEYIEKIMPAKLNYNLIYINNYTVIEYFKIIFRTLWHIFVPV